MLLLELFNQPAKYTETEDHSGPLWEFKVGDNTYKAILQHWHAEDADEFADIFDIIPRKEINKADRALFADGEGKTVVNFEFAQHKDDQYLHHVTGDAANVAQVFATVIEIFQKEVLPKIGPNSIVAMTAKEPSRVKLYDRLAKRFGKNVVKLDGLETVYAMLT